MSKTLLFQTIQFSVQKQFHFKRFSLAYVRSLNLKTYLFQAIQFSISTQFISIWLIDRTLLGATTPGQSGPGNDGNEGVLCITRRSNITRTSPSDCLVSYLGSSFRWWVLPLCREQVCILQPQPTGQKILYDISFDCLRFGWIGFFLLWHINLHGLFNAKTLLVE